MDWLNYHHLMYFWTVARTGSIAKASQELLLSPPTISAQIKRLEASLGTPLFRHESRRLVMTEMGRITFSYAEEIFSLGRELSRVVRERTGHHPLHLVVGVDETIPKLVVRQILRPAFTMGRQVHVVCREGPAAAMMADLADFRMDVVITDELPSGPARGKLYPHCLGEYPVSFLASRSLAARLKRDFPRSLDKAPALLPTSRTQLRKLIDEWFREVGVEPQIIGEFDDSALAKVFGGEGMGFFAVPGVIAAQVCRDYDVEIVGTAARCVERFYAVSVERRLKHPALLAITEAAGEQVLALDRTSAKVAGKAKKKRVGAGAHS